MPRATTKTTVPVKKSSSRTMPDLKVLKDLSEQLLTPEQFEAVTKVNYHHPDSRVVLHLFLHANYVWQIARKLQNDPALVDSFDWATIEKNSCKLVNDTLAKLLTGIDPTSWTGLPPTAVVTSKPARKAKPRLACGCAYHSYAAGVVDACQSGQEQGRDETWTGY